MNKEVTGKEGILVSRLPHSIMVSYSGKGMMLPPRGRLKIKDRNKVGAIPGGVQLLYSGMKMPKKK